MAESKKSLFNPSNPKKYKGNPRNIICRSTWENRFCNWCDLNENILEWASEEIALPYRSPLDNKIHRYFPDFYIKVKESSGVVKKMLIEVKPKKQTVQPKPQNIKTKGYIYEAREYVRNQAKWKAAKNFCEDHQWEFKVITEDELGINK